MKVRTLIKQEFENIFKNYDLIIMPTSPETAFKLGEKTDDPLAMYLADIYTVTLNMAGVPGITIPCGFDGKNLPIGMQIVAPQFGEEKMIQLAQAYEQATEWHKQKPKI
jgi:aspartyl-tRNA(Asn)/glutamyl-tRNA(Gln) amidotransferase subunit A